MIDNNKKKKKKKKKKEDLHYGLFDLDDDLRR